MSICDIISSAIGNLGVAQMVARYLGVVEAAGSNPVTQTKYSRTVIAVRLYFDSAIVFVPDMILPG